MIKKIFTEADGRGRWLIVLCVIAVALAIILPLRAQAANAGANGYIGEDKAKSIALEHAGLTADQVTFLRAHLDRDDRYDVYDIEFYSSDTEYDYEIDAVNGTIIEYDMDIERYSGKTDSASNRGTGHADLNSAAANAEQQPSQSATDITPQPAQGATDTTPQPTQNNTDTSGYIGEEKAKSIALEHAGLTAEQTTFLRAHLDRDDRRDVYDVEFYNGHTEYDYEIDAANGAILEYDVDYDD